MPLDRAPAGTMHLSTGKRAGRDVQRWMASVLADLPPMAQPVPEIAQASDGWTPQRAGEALVEALRWARYAAGQTGPAGMVGMRLPGVALTDEQFLELGWGIRESADDPADAPPMRVQLSARQVSRHEFALTWPAVYLVGAGLQGSARMVGLWAACRAYRRPFSKAIAGRGVSRPAAYALRDKGLSLISQGLARDRVPVNIA